MFLFLFVVVVMDASTTPLPAPSSLTRDGSPPLVIQYISKHSRKLDVARFGEMQMTGDHQSIYDSRFKKYWDTAVGAWIEGWCHCGGRGASVLMGIHQSTDYHIIRFYEKVDHEQGLEPILQAHRVLGDVRFPNGLADVSVFPVRMTSCTSLPSGPTGKRIRISSIVTGPAVVYTTRSAGTMSNSSPCRPWYTLNNF